uniref:Glycosyltransferase family 92 protein n=1 Tax=Rhabditophanes sp. KR3021 TaxID=114890 RepID=A0AC35UIP6_9BILA
MISSISILYLFAINLFCDGDLLDDINKLFKLNLVNEITKNQLTTPTTKNSQIKKLWRPPSFQLNCDSIMNNDKKYIDEQKKQRFTIDPKEFDLPMDCNSIKNRAYYPTNPLSKSEKEFPIAYARIVYESYPMIELFFAMSYSPQNHYCYSVDSKATAMFNKMDALSKCFPNVHLTTRRFDMNSNGDFLPDAHVECMTVLSKYKFKYLITQLNDDIHLKTNRETVEILKAMNWPANIRFVEPSPFIKRSIDPKKDWTYGGMKIFHPTDVRSRSKYLSKMKVSHQAGLSSSGLSKEASDYLANSLNLTIYLNNLRSGRYASDELFLQTLMADSILKVPSWIPKDCLKLYYPTSAYLMRHINWGNNGSCNSRLSHHTICTNGIEDLHLMKNWKDLLAYRFRVNQDFGAVICWAEYVYNKQYLHPYQKIDHKYYNNLPQAKYATNKVSINKLIHQCRTLKKI